MKQLSETLRALEAVEEEIEIAVRHQKVVKRQAWLASGRTIGRARQLITDATLCLLAQGKVVDAETLTREIAHEARDGDRFAVELCDNWLDPAMGISPYSENMRFHQDEDAIH